MDRARRALLTDALAARLDAMDQKLDLLLARSASGPRDQADVALLLALAEALGDRRFTSAQVIAHAQADPALAAALLAADITTAQELGCVCRRIAGLTLAGFRLDRVDARSRAGAIWGVRVCEAEPRILAHL